MCTNLFRPAAKHSMRWLALAMTAVTLSGCAWEAAYNRAHRQSYAQSGGSALAISRNAVFYLAQRGRTEWVGDHSWAVDYYHMALASCRGDPTTPLSAADVGKLGHQQVQIWVDGPHARAAILQKHYDVVMGGSIEPPTCTFKLVHSRILQLWLGQRYYDINLTKRTGYTLPVGTARITSTNQLAQLQAHRIGQSSVAGQPCTRWRIKNKNTGADATWCTWSGGKPWGLPDDTFQDFPDFNGTPVLRLHSAKDNRLSGIHDHDTTDFVVGHLPNTAVFTIPDNVKIEKQHGDFTAPGVFAPNGG